MLNLKEVISAIEQIAQEKGLPEERVINVLESALASAYKKEYKKKGEIVKAKLDTKTGKMKFWQVKIVLDDSMIKKEDEEEKEPKEGEERKIKFNPDRHIMIEEAKKINPDIKVGEELIFDLPEPEMEFGRIAAQTAKQVIMQKLREVEREVVYEEFKAKEGEIVSGLVQRVEGRNVFVDLGKTIGLMPSFETITTEHYRPGQRLRFYVTLVEVDSRGAKVYLSRSHPKFISRLFALEVPEIQEGIVEIKGIVREPGSRTKIAVHSTQEGVDAVGSCVGQRGSRVMTVLNEVLPERIDIIEWSEDLEKYVSNALSPAKVKEVKLLPKREVLVLVEPNQLSLAIGKEGQNVRLAAKLTGLKIDVRSTEAPDEVIEGGVADADNKNAENKLENNDLKVGKEDNKKEISSELKTKENNSNPELDSESGSKPEPESEPESEKQS